jgi:hypothetical protein
LEIWLQKVLIHLIVKLALDFLSEFEMNERVCLVKQGEHNKLEASENVLLLQLELILYLLNLLLIKHDRLEVIPRDHALPYSSHHLTWCLFGHAALFGRK